MHSVKCCMKRQYAEGDTVNAVTQPMPWDPMIDYRFMKKNTEDFMSLWRSYKPTLTCWKASG